MRALATIIRTEGNPGAPLTEAGARIQGFIDVYHLDDCGVGRQERAARPL